MSRESPYGHLKLAGVQEAVLQLEMRPGSNPQTVIKELEKPSPPRHSTATGFTTPEDTLRLRYRNWLPFRLAMNQHQVSSQRPDVALREILDKYSGDDATTSSADDWLFDAAILIWEAEGRRRPQSSLQSMDAETRHLPMAPTKLNNELLRIRELAGTR